MNLDDAHRTEFVMRSKATGLRTVTMTENTEKIGAQTEKVEYVGDRRWSAVKDPLIHHDFMSTKTSVLA